MTKKLIRHSFLCFLGNGGLTFLCVKEQLANGRVRFAYQDLAVAANNVP